MTPIELIQWALAIGAAIVILGMAAALAIVLVKSAQSSTKEKK